MVNPWHWSAMESGCLHKHAGHVCLPNTRVAGNIPSAGAISEPTAVKVIVGEGGCCERYLDSQGVRTNHSDVSTCVKHHQQLLCHFGELQVLSSGVVPSVT